MAAELMKAHDSAAESKRCDSFIANHTPFMMLKI
jgi:hypothetical protein